MWINVGIPNGEATNDILHVLLNATPGEIIVVEGPAKSYIRCMTEVLVKDDEMRRICVLNNSDIVYRLEEEVYYNVEPDVYVLSELNKWAYVCMEELVLCDWIHAMLNDGKKIIITGEQLDVYLPFLLHTIQTQHENCFSFYQYVEDDLYNINKNPSTHVQVGSLIYLGKFKRSISDSSMVPLLWKVVFRRGYMVWLLAMESVGYLNYGIEGIEDDWRHSPLRLWLNGQFLNGFSNEEIAAIIDNRSSGIEQGVEGTEDPSLADKVVLPDVTEVGLFLPNPAVRTLTTMMQRLTEKGRMTKSFVPMDWWLRTQGEDECTTTFVRADGSIDTGGKKVWDHCLVRPMILVDLNRLPEVLSLDAGE